MGGPDAWGELVRPRQRLEPNATELIQFLLDLGPVQRPRPDIDLRLDPSDNTENLLRWFDETDGGNLQLELKHQFHELMVKNDDIGIKRFLRTNLEKLIEINPVLPILVELTITLIQLRKFINKITTFQSNRSKYFFSSQHAERPIIDQLTEIVFVQYDKNLLQYFIRGNREFFSQIKLKRISLLDLIDKLVSQQDDLLIALGKSQ